jgi:Na+/H+ antiporter NhaD/arsenite permease-like protein
MPVSFDSFFSSCHLIANAGEVGWPVTLLFSMLLVGLIACLALEEKIHAKKSIIAGSFAAICLLLGTFCGILSFEEIVVGSHEIVAESGHVEIEFSDPVKIEYSGSEPETAVSHLEIGDAEESETSSGAGHADWPEQTKGESTSGAHSEVHESIHVDGERLKSPVYIPGIDWSVIAIILGSSLFVDVTSRSGLFSWIAIKVTKASQGDPLYLLFFYGIMTVVFSAVLNNVTAMIIVGSLTVVSLDKLGRREQLLGFLLIEGLLTNIGGLLTLISSVPNIIVGTVANISFVTFFLKSAPFVVVSTLITLWMGSLLFDIKRLKSEEEKEEAKRMVASFDENDGVESWGFFKFAAVMLCLFIIVIATTSVLPGVSSLGMGFVAMTFAVIMLWRYKSEVNQFYSAVDWDLLGFFMALFVVIYVMEHAQVLHAIGNGLQMVIQDFTTMPANQMDATTLLCGSAVFSSVTDNIPLAAMFGSILHDLGTPTDSTLWWAVIFGANLGGNLTPIGSASTLVAVTIMHKHKVPMSFAGFVKAAVPYAIVQIVLAVVYVAYVLPYF